jgi:DNA-binding IclR family transcriptional regulator
VLDAAGEQAVEAAVAQARSAGYAESIGQWHPAIHAVAAPVRTSGGEVVTLNCGGPAFLMPPERLRTLVVPLLLQAASALAKDIGGVAGLELTSAPEA